MWRRIFTFNRSYFTRAQTDKQTQIKTLLPPSCDGVLSLKFAFNFFEIADFCFRSLHGNPHISFSVKMHVCNFMLRT